MSAAVAPEAVAIRTGDGRELAGLLTHAAQPRGAMLINGATGTPREFYLRFAAYAAQRGYHALAYDFRGMGASRSGPVAAERVRMSDWGTLDMPAALDWLGERFPALPLYTIGHSIGGQFIGLLPNQARARAHVLIGASVGYWRWEAAPFRYQALWFWRVHGPLMLRRHGCVPQGRVWTGLPLPRGVFEQWREWCLRPEHFGPDLGARIPSYFGELRGPVLARGFTDDPIATPRTVSALLARFPRGVVEEVWTRPADIGARRIGHHGFFAERHRDALWSPVLDWLDARGA